MQQNGPEGQPRPDGNASTTAAMMNRLEERSLDRLLARLTTESTSPDGMDMPGTERSVQPIPQRRGPNPSQHQQPIVPMKRARVEDPHHPQIAGSEFFGREDGGPSAAYYIPPPSVFLAGRKVFNAY